MAMFEGLKLLEPFGQVLVMIVGMFWFSSMVDDIPCFARPQMIILFPCLKH